MQAQAAEFSGCAGKFRCFLERRVLKQFGLILYFKIGFLSRCAAPVKSTPRATAREDLTRNSRLADLAVSEKLFSPQ
jgi:hypothetical protein